MDTMRKQTNTYKLITILTAAEYHKKLNILYKKKTTGETVHRNVSPYEIKNGMLWATCGTHKNTIHQFILKNIKLVRITNATYKPKWEIKL